MNELSERRDIIVLDGMKIDIQPADIDGDGIVGEVETVSQSYEGIQPVMQPTELGETLQQLNLDTLDDTRMSGIDMRARLHPMSLPFYGALDSLVGFRIAPQQCLAFTRQMKRLSVSIKGLGRQEIVQLVGGKKEQDAKMGGFGDRMKGFFGGGQ